MSTMTKTYKNISANDVKEIMNDVAVQVIDVREPYEFDMGHIEVAVNIPLQTIPDRLDAFDKDKKIVLVCASGGRSTSASKYLVQFGYEVYNMVGGMMGWGF